MLLSGIPAVTGSPIFHALPSEQYSGSGTKSLIERLPHCSESGNLVHFIFTTAPLYPVTQDDGVEKETRADTPPLFETRHPEALGADTRLMPKDLPLRKSGVSVRKHAQQLFFFNLFVNSPQPVHPFAILTRRNKPHLCA